jgi:ribulose-5-phosphate 4-epimerase/fuculose-1-phosphate aldolase
MPHPSLPGVSGGGRENGRTIALHSRVNFWPRVVDAYGHLSVRHPLDPKKFIMSCYIAPGTISSRSDLIEYWVNNGEPVDPNSTKGYSERYIHSEILKRFPDIHSVMHSHSDAVVPYSISGQQEAKISQLTTIR